MKTVFRIAFLLSLSCAALFGQSFPAYNEGLHMAAEYEGYVTARWWARAGYTYLLQGSEDLVHWAYLSGEPEIGRNHSVGYVVPLDRPFFFRLQVIYDPNPLNTDHDGDGLTLAEERALGTSAVDLDSNDDGVPDSFAAYRFEPWPRQFQLIQPY